MKRALVIILSLIILAITVFACTRQRQAVPEARVMMLVGTAEIEQEGIRRPLVKDDQVHAGDLIHTGPRSAVIINLGAGLADIEIQEKAHFALDALDGPSRGCTIQEGNLWVRVNQKLGKDEEFVVKSKTAVASVRGTKFYTFALGDIQGTCMCEGSADLIVPSQRFQHRHNRDHLVFTRGDRTIVLAQSELSFMPAGDDAHRHSTLDASPLGKKQNDMTPDQAKKLMALIEQRFAAASAK